jgi:hypothetical protein
MPLTREPVHGRAAPRRGGRKVARIARRDDVDDVTARGEDADVLTQQRLQAAEARREYGVKTRILTACEPTGDDRTWPRGELVTRFVAEHCSI